MNEVQAKNEELTFHGSYSHDRNEQKEKAIELRKEGYRAVVVNCLPSKLSRGLDGMGYSVYVEKKYFTDRRIKEIKDILSREKHTKIKLKQEYEEKLNKLNHEVELLKGEYMLKTGKEYKGE